MQLIRNGKAKLAPFPTDTVFVRQAGINWSVVVVVNCEFRTAPFPATVTVTNFNYTQFADVDCKLFPVGDIARNLRTWLLDKYLSADKQMTIYKSVPLQCSSKSRPPLPSMNYSLQGMWKGRQRWLGLRRKLICGSLLMGGNRRQTVIVCLWWEQFRAVCACSRPWTTVLYLHTEGEHIKW